MSQLIAKDPCGNGLDRLTKSLGTYTGPTVIHLVDHSEHLTTDDILWGLKLTTLSELEQRTICTKVAIFAARSVLSIFENEYPNDQRPRLAIEAAEGCVRWGFSEESVERARQAEAAARAARAAAAWAVAAAARAAALEAAAAAAWARAAVRAAAWVRAVRAADARSAHTAAEWAILASDNPDALRAKIKNYLLELLRGYDA